MTTCEDFERRFLDWRQGALNEADAADMAEHSRLCAWCQEFSPESARLRETIRRGAQARPQPGFELRLRARIAAGSAGHADYLRRKRQPSVRWGALGAGLATGVALGIAMLLPTRLGLESSARSTGTRPALTASSSVDTMARRQDTLSVPESRYNPDRHSTVVSADR